MPMKQSVGTAAAPRQPTPGAGLRWLPPAWRIDVRRPASWIALATAVGVAAVLAAAAVPRQPLVVAAWLAGMLVTVAAIGDLPVALCADSVDSPTRRAVCWLCRRVAWPAAGMLGTAAIAVVAGGDVMVAAMLPSAGVAAAIVLAARLGDATAADAASLAVAAGSGTAAAAWWLAGAGSPEAVLATACLLALAVGLVVAATLRFRPGHGGLTGDLFGGTPPRTGEGIRTCPLPAQGPLRLLVTRAAMASSLAAMVAWLFLDPDRIPLYGLLAVAWFVALAVPRAALLDGVAAVGAWSGLLSAAADEPGRPAWLFAGRPLPLVQSAHVAISTAAILGWPPLVAALVPTGVPGRNWQLSLIVTALAAAAVVLTAVAAVAGLLRASGETLMALLLAMAAAVVGVAAVAATMDTASPPSLPQLPTRGRSGPSDRAAVERIRRSCQTSHAVQYAPVCLFEAGGRIMPALCFEDGRCSKR